MNDGVILSSSGSFTEAEARRFIRGIARGGEPKEYFPQFKVASGFGKKALTGANGDVIGYRIDAYTLKIDVESSVNQWLQDSFIGFYVIAMDEKEEEEIMNSQYIIVDNYTDVNKVGAEWNEMVDPTSEGWFKRSEDGKAIRHREDGPALIVYYESGNINYEHYYINGQRHREDGPAVINYNEDGSVSSEYYSINGIRIETYVDWLEAGGVGSSWNIPEIETQQYYTEDELIIGDDLVMAFIGAADRPLAEIEWPSLRGEPTAGTATIRSLVAPVNLVYRLYYNGLYFHNTRLTGDVHAPIEMTVNEDHKLSYTLIDNPININLYVINGTVYGYYHIDMQQVNGGRDAWIEAGGDPAGWPLPLMDFDDGGYVFTLRNDSSSPSSSHTIYRDANDRSHRLDGPASISIFDQPTDSDIISSYAFYINNNYYGIYTVKSDGQLETLFSYQGGRGGWIAAGGDPTLVDGDQSSRLARNRITNN